MLAVFGLRNMLRSMISRPLVGVLLALTAVHAIPQRSATTTTDTTSSVTSIDVDTALTTQTTVTTTSFGDTETTFTSTGTRNSSLTSSRSSTSRRTSSTLTPTATPLPSGTACNNSPLLCNRAYSNITHLGAHNSAFLRNVENGYSLAGNQYHNATVSLSAGVRLLQAQVHFDTGNLQLCHTSCTIMDAGSLLSWLSHIKSWLDTNPNEVVTLLLVNSDDVHIEYFARSFEQSGITGYSYVPAAGSASNMTAWPTLGELIAANTRLVSFVAGLRPSSFYPYLLDEWQYVFETPYEVIAPSFVCELNRPTTFSSGPAAVEAGMLPLVNHFAYRPLADGVLVPNEFAADQTNSAAERDRDAAALGRHLRTCEAEWQAKPVFALVDFWDHGPALDAVDEMNGVVGKTEGRIEAVAVEESGTSARFGSAEEKAARVGFVGFVVAVVLLF